MIKRNTNTDNIDRNIEAFLGSLLKVGIIVSGSIVAFGAIIFLVRHGSEKTNYHTFTPDIFNFSDFKGLFEGVIAFRSASIMELGILLLIATPVLRVLFSIFAFAYEKDYMYVIFTVIVLTVLIFSYFS
jgi:Predicted membrane protein